MIDKQRARHIAEGWGSMMTSSDPGVCMYALTTTGRIQSPGHRAELIAYIKTDCLKLVAERVRGDVTGAEENSNRVDTEELLELLDYVEHAPLESC